MADFERLTDTAFWEKVAYVLAGYMGATLLHGKVRNETDAQIPAEAYGAGVVVAGSVMGGTSGRFVSYGGGLHAGERLVERLRGMGDPNQ